MHQKLAGTIAIDVLDNHDLPSHAYTSMGIRITRTYKPNTAGVGIVMMA